MNIYWLYPETQVHFDVNDNVFAYSLALRTNEVWDQYCTLQSPLSCINNLTDHWVEYWGQGYPLPHFYQHLPSIIVVATTKLINFFGFGNWNLPAGRQGLGLYTTFRWMQFVYLSIFPLTLYWCARKFGFNRTTSALTGLLSTLISTQFLYGTDLNAVTWRGSGMTTQLMGMVTLPLALGSIYDSMVNRRKFARSAILLAFTFHMHILFGFIATLSALLLSFIQIGVDIGKHGLRNLLSTAIVGHFWKPISRLLKIMIPTVLLLAYWLLPLLSHNQLHNTSVWDEQIKFESYGAKVVTEKFLGGQLLDANRPPILTYLTIIGFLLSLSFFFAENGEGKIRFLQQFTQPATNKSPFKKKTGQAGEYVDSAPRQTYSNTLEWATIGAEKNGISPSPLIFLFLPSLFIFWFLLYFGPTTWGKLFSLIPGTEGLHVHRLINGLHFASFFLIAIVLSGLFSLIRSKLVKLRDKNIQNYGTWIIGSLLIALLLIPVFKERHEFMKQNTYLINEHKKAYAQEIEEFQKVLGIIRSDPGRVYAGRPGNWGKEFTTGGASNFLLLSENGISTLGWLPESWSPFSDIEQFWDETREDHYELMNVRWVYAPLDVEMPENAFEVFKGKKSQLARIESCLEHPCGRLGNDNDDFHFITVPFTVFSHKNNILNFDRLWLESDWPKSWSAPQVVLTDDAQNATRPKGGPVDGADVRMLDMGTFEFDGSGIRDQIVNLLTSKLFDSTPSALPKTAHVKDSTKINPHQYKVDVTTDQTLALMTKFTYHPYWHAKIDGKENPTFMVAPAFLATAVPPGSHTIEFVYDPPASKKLLLGLSLIILFATPFLEKFLPRET